MLIIIHRPPAFVQGHSPAPMNHDARFFTCWEKMNVELARGEQALVRHRRIEHPTSKSFPCEHQKGWKNINGH
jgi:hypothetical protein